MCLEVGIIEKARHLYRTPDRLRCSRRGGIYSPRGRGGRINKDPHADYRVIAFPPLESPRYQ